MKITIKTLCALLSLLLLSRCASLTKSQLTEVNEFGSLTANFSTYPVGLYTSYLSIHEKALMYSANSITGPEDHYKSISSAYQLKKSLTAKNKELDLTIRIIDKYGQSLVYLTSPEHTAQLDTASKSLGSNLDGLIEQYNSINSAHPLPTGIGGAVSELVTLGGEQFIRSRQAKEVKEFVQKADPMITQLADAMLTHLKGPLKSPTGPPLTFPELIANERKEVHQDYVFFLGYNPLPDSITLRPESLKQVQKKSNGKEKSKTSFKDTAGFPVYKGTIQNQRFATLANDQDCFQMLEDLDNLEILYNQTLTAIESLKKAHHKLLTDVREKKSLKEIAIEVQAYGGDVQNMYATLKAIKK
jgi:hypothetical protein